jgi:hypothetical protein
MVSLTRDVATIICDHVIDVPIPSYERHSSAITNRTDVNLTLMYTTSFLPPFFFVRKVTWFEPLE